MKIKKTDKKAYNNILTRQQKKVNFIKYNL